MRAGSAFLSQFPDGGKLGSQRGELGFHRSKLLLVLCLVARLFCLLQGLVRLCFVEIVTAERRRDVVGAEAPEFAVRHLCRGEQERPFEQDGAGRALAVARRFGGNHEAMSTRPGAKSSERKNPEAPWFTSSSG